VYNTHKNVADDDRERSKNVSHITVRNDKNCLSLLCCDGNNFICILHYPQRDS
jgi:hypothetical protein